MNNEPEKNNVLNWFNTGRKWIDDARQEKISGTNNTNPEESPVWYTIKQLLQQIDNSHLTNEPNLHWDISRRLEILLKDTENPTEKAHIYLEWGCIETKTGDHRDGLMKLKSALELYAGRPEEHAMLLFLIGCVEWMIPEQRNQSISSLGRAVKEFNLLQKRFNTEDKRRERYKNREELTQGILRALLDDEKFPPCSQPQTEQGTQNNAGKKPEENVNSGKTPESTPAGNVRSATPPASTPPDGVDDPGAMETVYLDLFKVWGVTETIPAGGFGPAGVDPYPVADVYLHQIIIDDALHNIHSLTSEHVIPLNSTNGYLVVKITGDSMNLAKPVHINSGDYVFVKLQSIAINNDIVVVGLYDADSTVTIKRYVETGRLRALKPESSNPKHTFIPLDIYKTYHIIGIALAVFKKI
jgi:hypothetical protein